MNHASTFRINFAIALGALAILMIAPLTFAQTTNYYNSMTPNPTGNPSITNTIIPGAANVPTGNSNTTVVSGVSPTGGAASGTAVPAVPNTGVQDTTATPGAPNTGAGGEAGDTLLMLALSALVAIGGIGTWVAMRKRAL